MNICYYEKNTSMPVLSVGLMESRKLFSDWSHIDVAFPISIGFFAYPFYYVVTLFHSATRKNVLPCCTSIEEIVAH